MGQFEVVEKLMFLYCYNEYEQRYMFLSPDGKVIYTDPHRGITHADLFDHLDGKRTLSVYGRKHHTSFMTIDVDEDSPESVKLLINKMEETGIPRDRIYVSTSGNKGYHLDVFFDSGVFKTLLKNYFDGICREPALQKIDFECFPIRHTAVKIPLGVNLRTGRRCWYLDRETLEPIESYEYVFGILPMSGKAFEEIVYAMNKKNKTEDIAAAKSKLMVKHARKSFPIRNEPVLTAAGQRHNLMCKLSVYLRKAGADEETICDGLMAWVNRQNPELIRSSMAEIEKDAASIARSAVRKYEPDVVDLPQIPNDGEIFLTPEDIGMIMKATTKNNRKVAFLICVYCRMYGSCSLSYKQIEQIIGASDMAAYRATSQLIKLGVITKQSCGGLTRVGGKPALKKNVYYFNFAEGSRKFKYKFSEVKNFDQFYRKVVANV